MLTLSRLEQVIRSAWALDTCDPADVANWTAANAARGQCGVTALVVHDLLGGQLITGEVHYPSGERQGYHHWNRFNGFDVDLTREQFVDGEVVSAGTTVPRPGGPPRRCAEQYERLRSRVFAALQVPA